MATDSIVKMERTLQKAAQVLEEENFRLWTELFDASNLETSADMLVELACKQETVPNAEFWEVLRNIYRRIGAIQKSDICNLRKYEVDNGYVSTKITLWGHENGGRTLPIPSGYKASWDLGNKNKEGKRVLNDARIRLIKQDWASPGETGVLARLHPFVWETWVHIHKGKTLLMYEGSRNIGTASVEELVRPNWPPQSE